jgi:hypothetical protein
MSGTPPVEWSAIPCCEEHGTRRETWPNTSFQADVTVRCNWGQRWSLVNDIRSNQRVYLENEGMYLANAVIAPAPGAAASIDGQAEVPKDALIQLTYTNKAGTGGMTESIEPDAENQVQDYSNFQWGGEAGTDPLVVPEETFANLKPNEAPGVTLRTMIYTITRYNALYLPTDYFDLVGTCNQEAYSTFSLGEPENANLPPDANTNHWKARTFKPETMLYLPGNATKTTVPQEQGSPIPGWTWTIRYKIREFSWNMFPRVQTLGTNPAIGVVNYQYMRRTDKPKEFYKPYILKNHNTKLLPVSQEPGYPPPPTTPLQKQKQLDRIKYNL